jgi:hypothetical protein
MPAQEVPVFGKPERKRMAVLRTAMLAVTAQGTCGASLAGASQKKLTSAGWWRGRMATSVSGLTAWALIVAVTKHHPAAGRPTRHVYGCRQQLSWAAGQVGGPCMQQQGRMDQHATLNRQQPSAYFTACILHRQAVPPG